MVKPQPTDFDIALGERVRTQRLLQQVSQQSLADGLGISFQQVQKYEKGQNRISVGRLCQIAKILKLSPSSFLVGLIYQNEADKYESNVQLRPFGYSSLPEAELRLIGAFKRISESSTQKLVLELVKVLGR